MEMRVRITWRPQVKAALVAWVDDEEFIWPQNKSVYRGVGRIEFGYPISDTDGYHEFEWTLLFPDEELRGLKVEVCWDGVTWKKVKGRKKAIKNTWSSFGAVP